MSKPGPLVSAAEIETESRGLIGHRSSQFRPTLGDVLAEAASSSTGVLLFCVVWQSRTIASASHRPASRAGSAPLLP